MKKILIFLLLFIFIINSCKKEEEKIIKVGIVTWGGYIAGIFANGGAIETKENSIYNKLGIKVKFFVIDDFEKCRSAFRSDTINVMWGTVDSFALEYPGFKNENPVAILQNDWSRGGDAIAVTKSINKTIDLKNKKIAVAEGTPSHFFVLHVLKKAGLTDKDVNWVFTKSAVDAANIFKSGSVDACVSWAPDVYVAAKAVKGAKILVSTKEEKYLIADILIAKKSFIEKNRELVKNFIKGWMKGVIAVNNDKNTAIKYLTSQGSNIFTGVDNELAEIMLNVIYLPTLEDNKEFFSLKSENPNYFQLFKNAEDLWLSVNKLKERIEVNKTVMPELLDITLD